MAETDGGDGKQHRADDEHLLPPVTIAKGSGDQRTGNAAQQGTGSGPALHGRRQIETLLQKTDPAGDDRRVVPKQQPPHRGDQREKQNVMDGIGLDRLFDSIHNFISFGLAQEQLDGFLRYSLSDTSLCLDTPVF